MNPIQNAGRLVSLLVVTVVLGLVSCGGGGGGGDDNTDRITIRMLPQRVIAFSDDSDGSLYPVVVLDTLETGREILLRVRDPYRMGDFYSIQMNNNFGGSPASGNPLIAEGEPDNSPVEAFTLAYGGYVHRGLDPLEEEDWFSFTSAGESTHMVSAKGNQSGTAADPVLEVYDTTMNPAAVTYFEDPDNNTKRTIVRGVYDPANNYTLIAMLQNQMVGPAIDIMDFLVVFSGNPAPGDYPVRFAGPPLPMEVAGSVTGSMHIDRYDEVDGRIEGRFDLTIVDVSRTTTVSGDFEVTRVPDEPNLLDGFRPAAPADSRNSGGAVKKVFAFLRAR